MGLGIGFSSSCYDRPENLSTSHYDRLRSRKLKDSIMNGKTNELVMESTLLPNPNPFNFKFKEFMEIGKYLVVKINYPDCVNYEGNKILVFKNLTMNQLLKFNTVDPHFSHNEEFDSPIARFIPSDDGWQMAINFAKMMQGCEIGNHTESDS